MTNLTALKKLLKIRQIGHFILILFCLTQIYCINPFVITDYGYLPPIKAFSVPNQNEAWLVTQKGKVFHFENAGQSNEEIKFGEKIEKIYFLNAEEGWAIDERNQLWATTNGGRNWMKKGLLAEESPPLLSGEFIFVNSRVGWVTSGSNVWVTDDGGTSWSVVYPTGQFNYDTLKGDPISISVVDSDVVWLGFSNGGLLRSTNRGRQWEAIKITGEYELKALHAFSADECYVSARQKGGIFHTADGGRNWRRILAPEVRKKFGFESLSFINELIGWAAGFEYVTDPSEPNTDRDVLIKTNDGWRSWEKIETGIEDREFSKVQFTDERNGWLLGHKTIYRTTDGGASWCAVFEVEDPNARNR